ncbi:MAG: SDR family NAD(P)-dependent oxidoreductase, partial [Actinomycetota bacterium]|nr:SDR family NAD(P)-dependent oxidoreductase [Actinomycetota bacterium]
TSRGRTLEIGGPENLTFNELARALQNAAGRGGGPRHVPPLMLRAMANTIGRMNPQVGRQARAALVMDHTDLILDAADVHRRFPDVPCTRLSQVLADLAAA